MNSKQPNYCIYPSLLNSFQRLLDSEIDAESFLNTDRETGEMRKTADEIYAEREKSLLDAINRLPQAPNEAADKGTAFNEIVDCLIENRKSSREDLELTSTEENGIPYICAKMNDFIFRFDLALCKQAARYFDGSTPQVRCEAILNTKYGNVLLYGYADEVIMHKVFDIKTTSNYAFGKYEHGWQKEVYPFCLVESGDVDNITEFEYSVYVLKGGNSRNPIITADFYKECYTYNHETTRTRLTQFVERFIEFLEAHRHEITDRKIFALCGSSK